MTLGYEFHPQYNSIKKDWDNLYLTKGIRLILIASAKFSHFRLLHLRKPAGYESHHDTGHRGTGSLLGTGH